METRGNVHREKIRRFKNVIQTWISENKLVDPWQIDIVTVRIVPREKFACVNLIDNVILE